MFDRKRQQNTVDEGMVDRIIEESRQEKNLKEQIYDRIKIPVWLLDIIIVCLFAALGYILIFKRG